MKFPLFQVSFPVFSFTLLIVLFGLLSCNKESKTNIEEGEIEIDSFRHLTPCLVEIVTNYTNYVLNDTIPFNDDYEIDQILSMKVDSIKYYWIMTDWEDETEYILTEECDLFCNYNGWTGFNNSCLSQFKDSIWTMAWRK